MYKAKKDPPMKFYNPLAHYKYIDDPQLNVMMNNG